MVNPMEFFDRKPEGQPMPPPYYQQGNPPPMAMVQYPVYDNYPEKLYYAREKAAIELQKEQELCFQRLELERMRQEIKLQSKVRQDMLSYEVYKDAMGRIAYSRVGTDQEKFCSAQVACCFINKNLLTEVVFSSNHYLKNNSLNFMTLQ